MAHLTSVVNKIANNKGIQLGSVSSDGVRGVERRLERKEIDIGQAIDELQGIDKIRLDFSRNDYEKIRKEMR